MSDTPQEKVRIPRPYRLKPTCRHGHPYEGDNLTYARAGYRLCRTCQRDQARRAHAQATALGIKRTAGKRFDPSELQMTEKHLCNIEPIPITGCWLWAGSWDKHKYGRVSGTVTAHRFFYAYFNGPITNGLHVLHKCDTPACVNPDHLFLGTHQDNMADKMKKKRHLGRWKNRQQALKETP